MISNILADAREVDLRLALDSIHRSPQMDGMEAVKLVLLGKLQDLSTKNGAGK